MSPLETALRALNDAAHDAARTAGKADCPAVYARLRALAGETDDIVDMLPARTVVAVAQEARE